MIDEPRHVMLDRKRKNLCAQCGVPEIDGMYDDTHILVDGEWKTTFTNPVDMEYRSRTQGHPFKQKVENKS
jgi:hypothetical protein